MKLAIATVGLIALATTIPASAQDAAAGSKSFGARCAVCHGRAGEGTPMGPSLKGVFMSKAASNSFPRYTPALKASKLVWTQANLDAFLAAPKKLVPGTAMFMSLPMNPDRANVIAHLKTLKK